jgi:hypothetical protein
LCLSLCLSALDPSAASAAGILPPSNPPANITFDVAPPCYSVDDPSAACLETLLHDINAGRNSEGLPSMVLPNGFAQMSGAEQLLVLANLERGVRGLAQFAGLSPTLNAVASLAAAANADPSPPAGYAFSQWGSNYAGAVDPLESDFLWMYDDGVGGTNYDCQAGNFSGCWGHRDNILGPWANSGSETTAMGDAATSAGAFTEIFANKWGTPDAMIDPYSSVTYPSAVAPQVVQVSPAGVTALGTGTQVTIDGNYFSAFSAGQVPTVDFGSTPATNVHVNWDGQLTADAPPDPLGGQADTVTVTVTTPAGTSDATVGSGTDAFTYSADPAPSVTSVSPAVGSQEGGTQVTIAGTNLAWATGVAFGSTPAAAFTVNSATSITATAPATTALGPVDVVVTTYGGASGRSSGDIFDYKLNSTTTPTVSANQSTQGAALTYSATVAGSGATPTGTVTFRVGSTTLCTTPALVGGTASCQSTATPPGSDTATATYSGDANFAPSSGTQGVVVTSGDFSPLVPTRICDTRSDNPSSLSGPAAQCNGPGNSGSPVGADSTKTINVSGNFGVPADATAVVLNVTVVNPAAPGYITVFPTGAAAPNTSNLNFGAGDVVPNQVEVGTGTNGDISLFSSAQSNVVIDVEGFVSPTSSGAGAGLYNPLPAPTRVCDTRAGNPSALTGGSAQCNGSGGGERLGAGSTITVQIAGVDGVPANASAAVLNVTVVDPTAAGYLTVFPQGATQPTASNVNYVGGEVTANRVTVPLSSGPSPGEISIYSSSSADVVVDVSGSYTSAGGTGSQFTTEVSPVRVCDTRAGDPSQLTGTDNQCDAKTIGADGTLTLQVTGLAGVPSGAKAVVVNVTAVSPTMPTYLTVYPGPTRATASDLNPVPGEVRANLTVATINANGTITVYNSSGSIDVVVDVLGWYG